MAKRLAISIGVKKAGNLPALPGALTGAHQFAKWAKGACFETALITDEKAPVTIAIVKNALTRMLSDDVERLLVYFSGHGTASVSGDFWLLSNWESDPNEAVNVSLSFNHAKRQHITKIAIFADACRSVVPQAAFLGGANIFPYVPVAATKSPQWDMFLATRLSEIAQEVGKGDPVKSYGVFTNELMSALEANEGRAFVPAANGDQEITSPSLADWLEETVPFESGKIPGAITQYPDISVAWRPPDNNYVVRKSPAIPPMRAETSRTTRTSDPKDRTFAIIAEARVAREREIVSDLADKTEAAVARSLGVAGFEAGIGVSVFGTDVEEVVVASQAQPETFSADGGYHIRLHATEVHSVLFRTPGDRWAATIAIPGYVNTALFDDGRFVGMTYSRSREASWGSQAEVRETLALVAKLTTALRFGRPGKFKVVDSAEQFDAEERLGLQGDFRSPTSIVLAAYLSERRGRLDRIRALLAASGRNDVPIPFDVPMLAGWPADGGTRGSGFVGSFPLLAAGWAFLDEGTPNKEMLLQLRPHLVPGTWTTFDAEGGRIITELVKRGRL